MINPYHLRYFVDAAKAGSLSEAARKNRVSQSAVSQAIRSLEKSLGFELITHQKKLFHLTDEGRVVLEQAEGVFRSLEQLAESVQNIGSGYAGVLKIGCTNTVALGPLTPILSRVGKEHPKLTPVVRIGNSEVIKDWLLEKEIDIGILVDDGFLTKDFGRTVLRNGSYVLFRGKRTQADQDGLVVTRRERSEVQYFLRHLARRSHPLRIQCEITSWEAVKNYVLLAGGYGISPDYVVEQEVVAKKLFVEKVPFKLPTYKLVVIHRANHPLGKNGKLLVELLASPRL